MKMIKFAMSPSGEVVYRESGRIYRPKTTVKKNRVYGANGRLIGYIGKPNKTQQRAIDRLDKQRQTRRRSRDRARALDDRLATLEDRYQTMEQVDIGVYTRRQMTEINFGHFLTAAVKDGKMTAAEARRRLDEYLRTESSDGRTKQWDELKSRFEELGFPYP